MHSVSTDALDDGALLPALRNGDEYAFVHYGDVARVAGPRYIAL